jgi:hypothetical protein
MVPSHVKSRLASSSPAAPVDLGYRSRARMRKMTVRARLSARSQPFNRNETRSRHRTQRRARVTAVGSEMVLVAIGLVAVVVVAMGGVVLNPFVSFDDPEYVVQNPLVRGGLGVGGIGAALRTICVGNWHPLTMLSHMLDVELFGLVPAGHHLTSLALHAAASVLLMLVLVRATGALGRSALVAVFFAVHPLHVESVAWVAERKDVLCGVMWMVTIRAYLAYVARPTSWRYAGVAGSFTLALLAKPMAVTLPLTLALIDFWPLRRTPSGMRSRTVLEKVPLLLLGLVGAAIAVYTQRASGMMGSIEGYPPATRLANAVVGYTTYLGKTVWPADLAVFYPLDADWSRWSLIARGALLVAISACTVLLVRRAPYLLMGWLWYLVTLIPVIGLVQVGDQSTADRYTYVPLIGVFIAFCWSAGDLCQRHPRWRTPARCAAALAVVACVIGTWRQVGYWRSSEALFRRALAVTRDNYVAENNLANVLERTDRAREAELHYRAALRIRPADAVTHNNLANLLAKDDRLADAAEHYAAAIAAAPGFTEAHYNLGVLLRRQGRLDEAIEHLRAAVRSNPDMAVLRETLDGTLAERRRGDAP